MRVYVRRKTNWGTEWLAKRRSATGPMTVFSQRLPATKAMLFDSEEAAHKAMADYMCNPINGWTTHTLPELVPGLKEAAAKYNQNARALAGTGAMLTSLLTRLGYPYDAHAIQASIAWIKQAEATKYKGAKARLEKEAKDAKPRQ